MVEKRFFVLGVFFVFLISSVFSASIVDATQVTDATSTQSFVQVNARLTELANQISNYRAQDQNFQANAFMKSDVQALYNNMVNINRQMEQQIILDNLIIVVMAFAIMFILIGKNLLPQNKKEKKEEQETPLDLVKPLVKVHKKEPKVKEVVKKPVEEEQIINPEPVTIGDDVKW